MHDTKHADDDTTSVGEPDEGGGHDKTPLPPVASMARSVPTPTR
jgi:hypothetical protein